MLIQTFNSKTNINGNRLNLVINHETRSIYFYGCNAMSKGVVIDGLTAKNVKDIKSEYERVGYTTVDHATASKW